MVGKDNQIVIAEGVEEALTFAMLFPELRIIAATSVDMIGKIVLPKTISEIIIAAQNDLADSSAAIAMAKNIKNLSYHGFRIRIMRPPQNFKDWNDFLQDKER